MTEQKNIKPDYIFETSWEICNKVGGIYTVVSTKAPGIQKEFEDNYILIGPDVWKETNKNPDFIEDRYIYRSWREHAEAQGIRLRIGRWNIESNPIVVLVDFTPYFQIKDKIFANFWETYQLDSISGQWDYVEPALFGYAAAKVIESFYEFNLTAHDRIIAHFHEWMTGTGVLYLREYVPQVGCVFTTHATALGRAVAGNHLPLYGEFSSYPPDAAARRFDIVSKFSLERAAALSSDAFTTVSDITALECSYFLSRPVDLVTPNGFDDSFTPDAAEFENRRGMARIKLMQISRAMFNIDLPDDTLLLVNSGRYEFRNKGIDLYIDALAELNKTPDLNRTIIGFITVPANHSGPSASLVARLNDPDFTAPTKGQYLTHGLFEPEHDQVLNKARAAGLLNRPEDKVKLIFVPSYLSGSDGVFNFSYYELLIGFDLSVFPSYYEPWGYTPLESLAFHIPTITTSLAGFGLWIREKRKDHEPGAWVIDRTDTNSLEVTHKICSIIQSYAAFDRKKIDESREKAFSISRIALWHELAGKYHEAYSVALKKVQGREELFRDKRTPDLLMAFPLKKHQAPVWNKVLVKPGIPERFNGLKRISRNLWWAWQPHAMELFRMIDPIQWEALNHNPIALIESLTVKQMLQLERNEVFLNKLDQIYEEFETYMKKASEKPVHQVAYFSMEYGLHDTVQIFSGGLGVLAGDYLKEASDSNVNLVAVGLLYRYGYFRQNLSTFGDQIASYSPQKFTHMPLKPVRNGNGEWVMITLALPGRTLYAKVWKLDVGRIPLYLLDADLDENNEADRMITHQLYGGDWDNRFKQELLLGVGGIRLLNALHQKPDIYHCNEGHAAFIGIERLRLLVQDQKFSFDQAVEIVRSTQLFTTHTPVPAGHDAFSEDVLRAYIPHYADRLNITWNTFMNLGRFVEDKLDEKFSMSVLATRLSQEMNGVSRIHGRVSREMFQGIFEGYFADELYISHVTNGVHLPTWTSPAWQALYKKTFGDDFLQHQSDRKLWEKIQDVPDEEIWKLRQQHRKELFDYLRRRLGEDLKRRQESPKFILRTLETLNEKTLTIGFARRFATYKRAYLLFNNLDRLSQLVNNAKQPVQFIFAGKAHPADKAGQDLIKRIIEVSKMPEFTGKIIFVENYDMSLGAKLVQGVDVWLNTPTRPLEASGTSGEKAIMNGVVNFSVLDGWWAEGYKPDAGWALQEERTYENQQFQDELDAESIYNIFAEEIVPHFYDRDEKGIPHKWVSFVKNTISGIAPEFTMKRMIDDYYHQFYNKLVSRSTMLFDRDFEGIRQLSSWKRKMIRGWDSIETVSVRMPDSTRKPLRLGENYIAEVVLNVNELAAHDVGLEILFGHKVNDEVKSLSFVEEMTVAGVNGNIVTFFIEIPTLQAGVFDFAFRLYPKHPLLPHRQDFNLVKWISQ
ncbi:MAG: alpha-glucan family phosphorylase [Bacteroidales bacterium]|nr:alpha-glucan family phosphorylase [Bacteroidales bacterium]